MNKAIAACFRLLASEIAPAPSRKPVSLGVVLHHQILLNLSDAGTIIFDDLKISVEMEHDVIKLIANDPGKGRQDCISLHFNADGIIHQWSGSDTMLDFAEKAGILRSLISRQHGFTARRITEKDAEQEHA